MAIRTPGRTAAPPQALWAAGIALWALVVAAYVQRAGGMSLDDFFVTFRYARHLAEGQGFVYNPGERTLGLTNAGLALLLAVLHRLSGIAIPHLATAVFGAALLGAALLLLAEGRRRGRGLEAYLGGTMVLLSGYVWSAHGGASTMVLLLLLAAAVGIERRPALAGILAGFAVWFRPDALAGVGLLALLRWAESRRPPWRYALAAGAAVGLGAFLATAYFGSFVPITLASKRLLADLHQGRTSGAGFWPSALPMWRRHGGALAHELLAAGVAGQAFLLRHGGRATRLLGLYGLALALAYPLLGVAFFTWYAVPTVVALLYAVPFLAMGGGRALGRWIGPADGGPWIGQAQDGPRLGMMASVAVLTLLGYTYGQRSWHGWSSYSWHYRMPLYRQAAEWIASNSPPGAAISCLEIGAVGYFSRRPLQDLMGMVSPQVHPFLKGRDLRGALMARPTEFVLGFRDGGFLGGALRSAWFRRNYSPVQRFEDAGGRGAVQVFRRLPVPLPAETRTSEAGAAAAGPTPGGAASD